MLGDPTRGLPPGHWSRARVPGALSLPCDTGTKAESSQVPLLWRVVSYLKLCPCHTVCDYLQVGDRPWPCLGCTPCTPAHACAPASRIPTDPAYRLATVSEEQCLYQIYIDELYGGLQRPSEDEKKK